MGDVIVIGGKGGTGKTSLAALLTLGLAKKARGPVLAVDADPNSTLSLALGVRGSSTVADIIEEVARTPESVPPSMGKDAYIALKIHSEITESRGFDLLVMGRPEGPGCYCYINNVLRNCLGKLIAEYRYTVIDNEAGMEHFSRKTTRECSDLVIVSDETPVGLRSAQRIFELVDEMGIATKRRYLFVNKAQDEDVRFSPEVTAALDGIFYVPFDPMVARLVLAGKPLTGLAPDSKMLEALRISGDQIWPQN